ncbi:IPT/TIG domain-containing protein, partial [Arthrobacter sp.]|uniref:IPT/TIG domain-containing protein n=1 Tax=Arthrobacter sp. TaxID=1667 RepID=UPI0026E0F35B
EAPSQEPATPGIKLSADTVAQGGKLTITGENFKAGSSATFTLHSEPVQLGTATADANGVVSLSVVLPSDTPAGQHRVLIDGVGLDGEAHQVSAPLTVTASAANVPATDQGAAGNSAAANDDSANDDLANTGANNTWLGGLAVLLVLAGATAFAATRRRSATH